MSAVKVAVVQMVSSEQITQNLERASTLIAAAAKHGAKFIQLPEAFAVYGQKDQSKIARYEAEPIGPIRHFLSKQAKLHSVYLQGGTIPCAEPLGGNTTEKAFASSFVFGPDGEELGRYDKLHLFDAAVEDQQGSYKESDTFDHGAKPVAIELPFATLGMSVCYDVRFPELYRHYATAMNVDVLTVPSAFTDTTGEAHWLALLQARAIENACYVLAANQGGDHGKGRETYGHSCIIDPWGRVLAEAEKGETVLLADIDIDNVKAIRKAMPVLQHRRFDVVYAGS